MNEIIGLLDNIRRLVRLFDAMLKPVCAQFGLTSIEVTIISFLYHNPGRDTAADIVELRMLSKGNVSQAVESLIQKSLLRREQDKDDRRKIHLSLTENTKPIIKEIESVRDNFRSKVFHNFTIEERQQFAKFNERMALNTNTVWEKGEF